jgi:T5SS/PEP-CTERM-associated repeat protein
MKTKTPLLAVLRFGLSLVLTLIFSNAIHAADLYVGSNSANVTTSFTSGTNTYSNTIVGFTPSASNNTLDVSGGTTLLSNSASLTVGSGGAGNLLTISGAGTVRDSNAVIGASITASNNSVSVSGSGSTWNNSGTLTIGNSGSENNLYISSGGTVRNTAATLGSTTNSSNNAVTVSGSGSSWSNNGITIGSAGSFNRLVVNTAAVVTSSGTVTLGTQSNSIGNTLQISDSSTVFNAGAITVGGNGSLNSLTLENGALSTLSGAFLVGSGPLSTNNGAIVTGSGTVLDAGGVTVGHNGSSNSLTVSIGGHINTTTSVIGNLSASSNNRLLVTGSGSQLNNSSSITVGFQGAGTLTVANGGSVTASAISIASQSGSTGTLNLGALGGSDTAGTLGSSTITFGSGSGAINFNQSDTATISNKITGTGAVSQLGSGTTVLISSNNYSGTTAVSAGRLVVASTGALGSGSSNAVNSGGTLENHGAIAGATTLNSGGTLAGNGGTFGAITIKAGSFLNWNVNSFTNTAGVGWDQLSATNIDLTNLSPSGKLTIQIAGTSGIGNGGSLYTFNFFYGGTVSGFDTNNIIIDASALTLDSSLTGGTWAITETGTSGANTLNLTYTTAVPEPSTYALFGLGAVGLLMVLRRKKTA